MSVNLCWRPVRATPPGTLPAVLKNVLRKSRGVSETPKVFGFKDRGYLEALADLEIEGAQQLMDLIEKFGEVELWLE